MKLNILTVCLPLCSFLLLSTVAISQKTSVNQINLSDSGDYFLQKGLLEKQNGRRLESLKNFEKASRYDGENKAIVTELATAYMDLHKYNQARESYKKQAGIILPAFVYPARRV